MPDVSAYVAVNEKHLAEFNKEHCSLPVACPAIACPGSGVNPNIAARCVAGRCQAFDVRNVPEYSGCQINADCHLRAGLGCCTCGTASSGWVAVGKNGEQGIAAAECSPNAACPDCIAIPPMGMTAICSSHVCQVAAVPVP